MRTLLQFMSEFSTAKDPYAHMAQFQAEIDSVVKDLEEEKKRSEFLRSHNQDLESQLQQRSLANSSVAQHNLDVQQQVNNQLQKELKELKKQLTEDQIKLRATTNLNQNLQIQVSNLTGRNESLTKQLLKSNENAKELKEARDTLAAVLETKSQSKVFYKGSPDTDWIPLETGHVTLEFKTTSSTDKLVQFCTDSGIRGFDQPLKFDPETVIIDDPQHESHSIRKLNGLSKEDLIKKARRQANEITRLSFEKEKYKEEVHRLHRHLRIKESLKEFPKTQQILGEKPTPEEIEAFNRYNDILRTEIYREREDNKAACKQLATMADRVKELYQFLKKQQEQTEAILHPQRKD